MTSASSPIRFRIRAEIWPLASAFVISRGAKTSAEVVVVEAWCDGVAGRGEAVPYARYGETMSSVLGAIEAAAAELAAQRSDDVHAMRAALQAVLPAGAARNALDCALWDLEAKVSGRSVNEMLNLAPPAHCLTCYTLSLDTPEAMASKALAVGHLPLLKLKLGGPGDAERMRAVRAARPDARLVADANEAWIVDMLPELFAVAAETKLEVVEQPLPAGSDGALAGMRGMVPVCADESLHTRGDLARIAERYDAINVKLDKAGGLTEALALTHDAHALGLKIMTGCMVATSLAMAPALLLAPYATWVDLDGPLLLARDREAGLKIENGVITPPQRSLWG